MSYACMIFAHTHPTRLYKLQIVQNKFIRRATGAQWYQRNVDLHSDYRLPTIREYFKDLTKRFFDRAEHHPNPLVVSAANYQPDTNANVNKRRPRNVLIDPVEEGELDTPDPPPGVPPDNNTTPTASVTTNTIVRPRLRARRDQHNAYTRYTRVLGRFSPPPATD
ncbi:unnamed protein product, partial [Iphiclides podalirius]